MNEKKFVVLDGKKIYLDELQIFYRGSVKDILVIEKPTSERMGLGIFRFWDNFSLWGLKDLCREEIPGKGAAVCLLGAKAFEMARRRGIDSIYLGLIDDAGRVVTADLLERPTNLMLINLAQIIKPEEIRTKEGMEYDYSMFREERNFLVPLEIIYRSILPQGSSKLREIHELRDKGNKEMALYEAKKLGLDHIPLAGEKLPELYLEDMTTKFEFTDREVDWLEGQAMAGLDNDEQMRIIEILEQVCQVNTELLGRAGVDNADGKIEVVLDPFRQIKLANIPCSMDESRFYYQGAPISKENIRQYYEQSQPDFYQEVKRAKVFDKKDWKDFLKGSLAPMDPEFKAIMAHLYPALTDACFGRKFGYPKSLDEVALDYKRYIEKKGWVVK